MYILCAMLIIGLICNFLVKPVDPRWHMSQDDVTKLQAVSVLTAAPLTSSYGIAKAGSICGPEYIGPLSVSRWFGESGSRSDPRQPCSADDGRANAAAADPTTAAALAQRTKARSAMALRLMHGVVSDRSRHVIHAVRVLDVIPDFPQIEEIAERMRSRMLARHGEQMPKVVIIVGNSRETLRLFGEIHAVALVRTALFNAALSWSPLQLDEISSSASSGF
jgi:hypothetical protein